MGKELLARTLQKVISTSTEECYLSVEEVGVLSAFLKTRRRHVHLSESERALHEKIAALLRQWRKSGKGAVTPTKADEERRTQLALRSAVAKLQQDRLDDLTPDEIRLLQSTYTALCKKSTGGDGNQNRLLQLIEKLLERHDRFISKKAYGDGDSESVFDTKPEESVLSAKPSPAKTNEVNADKDFLRGQPTHFSVLQDIPVDFSARVFEYEGDTIIRGNIPADVLVKVVNGGITLHGFAAGHAVAKGDIVIKGNVQGGVIISEYGDISLERGLIGSRIISKRGNVICKDAEAPQCIFGWRSVKIGGDVLGGRIYSPRIEIANALMTGVVTSCGTISARKIAMNDDGPTVVCLRRMLTSEDYGRPLEEEIQKMIRRIGFLKFKRKTLLESVQFAGTLKRDCHRTALFYLMGGAGGAMSVENLQGLYMKAARVAQFIDIAESAREYYSSLLSSMERPSPEELAENLGEWTALLEDIEGELPDANESVHARYTLKVCHELIRMLDQLNEQFQTSEARSYLRTTYVERIQEWQATLEQTRTDIDAQVARFNIDKSVLEELHRDPAALEGLLEQQLERLRNSSSSEDLSRANSPFIRLIKDHSKRHDRNIKQWMHDVKTIDMETRNLRKDLTNDSRVLFGELVDGECYVQAHSFACGVELRAVQNGSSREDGRNGNSFIVNEAIASKAEFALAGRTIVRRS